MTDYQITAAMMTYGGSFVSTLGKLFRMADERNMAKLKAAFPEYWDEYRELAQLRADTQR